MTLHPAYDARLTSAGIFVRLFHASPVALTFTLAAGCYLEVNDSYLRETGYTREEVMGHRSVELGLWASAGNREHIVRALRPYQTLNDCEIVIRTKSGEQRALLAFFELIEVKGQTCIFSLFRNVTERQRAQSILKKLSSVVEQTADNC